MYSQSPDYIGWEFCLQKKVENEAKKLQDTVMCNWKQLYLKFGQPHNKVATNFICLIIICWGKLSWPFFKETSGPF